MPLRYPRLVEVYRRVDQLRKPTDSARSEASDTVLEPGHVQPTTIAVHCGILP